MRQYKLLYSIGDSISIGYLPHLMLSLAEHYTVAHCPGNGSASTRIIENLSDWMAGYNPDVVLLNCGLHDIKPVAGRTATLPDQYEANLRDILDILSRLCCSPRIVWCSTTPVIEERLQAVNKSARRNSDIIAYNQLADKIMMTAAVESIDLYGVVVNNDPAALLAPDGVHFTNEGYQTLAEAITDYLVADL